MVWNSTFQSHSSLKRGDKCQHCGAGTLVEGGRLHIRVHTATCPTLRAMFEQEQKRRKAKRLKQRQPIRRVGKKAKLRETVNRRNRTRFAAMGLLGVCEARLPGCWPSGRLTWMHGRKDRYLTMEEREFLVIRACTVCHRQGDEEMTHEQMLSFVQKVIAGRKL